MRAQSGVALVAGLLLLSLITLLGLAGAAAAQVDLQLARNEQFGENAASAASAGIEMAIRQVTVSTPETVPARLYSSLPGDAGRFEAQTRFIGYEFGLPQTEGANLAAAHFEITSTGFAARNATRRQRAIVMRVVEIAGATGTACEPRVAGVPCSVAGEIERLSWQRLP
ncbi:MAG TPA: hypothetical protein VM146_00845 [Steroidobacteraceae bacterium]|nr:hypothetical protein [Steroidobacteraceae bacterium]